jgi:four helix bundle protein
MSRLPDELRNRTKAFASACIRLYCALPRQREEVRVLGHQMLRSGTSVAAHIREASRGRSTSEFVAKLGGALQEVDETALWLELLRQDCGITTTAALETESSELTAIFVTIINRSEGK